MKYLVVLCDGMADRPYSALDGKTPMEAAKKPIMDMLCKKSTVGTVLNVPTGMVPESDTANLAVLSYDPSVYSKGRSPLEAAAMGITMQDDDTAFRCNLVTLTEEACDYAERTIIDHGADNISSEDAAILMKAVEEGLSSEDRHFYPGMSYRESMIVKNAPGKVTFSRPHDIPGKVIGDYLPAGDDGDYYADLMRRSYDILVNHPLNIERKKNGLHPANSIWFWSPGKRAALPNFNEKWGVSGSMISAVDLLKGIAFLAGMEVLNVEGATGTVDTNYKGKAKAAIDAFERGQNFVYIHLEGPDECGHQGDTEGKVRAIESIDSLVLAPLYDYLSVSSEPFRILVLPDHPTPLEIRTHSPEPVPFFMYSSTEQINGCDTFTEENACLMPLYVPKGQNLLSMMIETPANGSGSAAEAESEKKNSSSPPKKGGAISSQIFDIIETLVFSLVTVLLIMTLLVRHSPVDGSSMNPTLNEGDILVVSDILYTPKIGDMVILQVDAPTHGVTLDRPLVKRIVALGGDKVRIDFNNWEIRVNDIIIEQNIDIDDCPIGVKSSNLETDENGICEFTVSKDCVFVLGDNRRAFASLDSRSFGEVDIRCIVGKVVFRILPLKDAGFPS